MPANAKPPATPGDIYFTGEGSLPSGKIPDGIFLQAQECAFAPGSRFLPCAKGTLLYAQTKTSLRLSSPYAGKAVYALPCKIKKPPKWRFYILPGKGLEPLSPKGQWFLRPSCIPIPAPRRKSFVLRKSYIFILANFMLKRKSFL